MRHERGLPWQCLWRRGDAGRFKVNGNRLKSAFDVVLGLLLSSPAHRFVVGAFLKHWFVS
jgi:hypothetical protein